MENCNQLDREARKRDLLDNPPKYRRVMPKDRKDIEELYNEGIPLVKIAAALGFNPNTVRREVKNGLKEDGTFSAELAQSKVQRQPGIKNNP